MKKFTLLVPLLFALLFAGCATTEPKEDIHARVLQADKDWAEFAGHQNPKMWDIGIIARERRIYDKVAKSDAPEWRKRRAGWNYVIAVNEARIPDIPKPPGRGTVQNDPFF